MVRVAAIVAASDSQALCCRDESCSLMRKLFRVLLPTSLTAGKHKQRPFSERCKLNPAIPSTGGWMVRRAEPVNEFETLTMGVYCTAKTDEQVARLGTPS
jgi:hypothetical protein